MVYKRGSRGGVVKQIQKALNLYPDGIFGIITEDAVKDYQKEHNLTVDGIVGPVTLALLLKQRFILKKSKRRINEIIIHCSATPEGKDYTVEDIRDWHRKRGFADIGYHYVIYRDGTVNLGRNVDLVGAHCAIGGHNTHSIGICYIGGVDNLPGISAAKQPAKDTRTEEQKAALLSLLLELKKYYPEAKIYGHHDFDKHKACPSFDARKEYAKI